MGEMSLRQDLDNSKRSLIATILRYMAIQMFKVSVSAFFTFISLKILNLEKF